MGAMKVLWSALSLVVVGVLAVFLWNAAATTTGSETLHDGVAIDGGPSGEPTPDATTATPAEAEETRTAEARDPAEDSTTEPADAGVQAPAAEAPAVEPPAGPDPAPPAQVPVPVQPAPHDFDDDWDEWDDDWDEWDDDDWDDD